MYRQRTCGLPEVFPAVEFGCAGPRQRTVRRLSAGDGGDWGPRRATASVDDTAASGAGHLASSIGRLLFRAVFLTARRGEFVWHLLQGKDIFLETQVSAVDRLEIGGIEAAVAELL